MKEALKLALEAMQQAHGDYHLMPNRVGPKEAFELMRKAITAAQKALAQPEQEPVSDDIASILACRDMLDAQPVPPQPEQEPVAILNHAHGVHTFRNVKLKGLPDGEYLVYTHQPQRTEQVPAPGYCKHCKQYTIEEPLPPQRKPLSAEQVSKICAEWTDENGNTSSFGRRQIARAIEAAHDIKENT